MEKITLCGDDCLKCPRHLARTEYELQATAELWHRVGWRDKILDAEEMRCQGCFVGKPCAYQLTECVARHKVEKCRRCAEFPCVKINGMLARSAAYEKKCRSVCSPKEYEMLKAAFFNKEENLNK